MPDKSKNPFRFFQELRRRKVIRVITVYCAAAFVIIEVSNNIADSLNLPGQISKWIVIALALGLIITIILSWIFDITPEGIQKTKPVEELKAKERPVSSNRWKIATYVSIVVIIALIVFNIFYGSLRAVRLSRMEKSIAVLPFRYLSNDSSQVHFCSGIQEEVLNDLSSIKALSVRSRTSTETYKDSDKATPVIGEELDANFLVEGSFGLEKNKIKVWIQLIIAPKDEHIWANEYEGELTDIFTVQSEIAEDIAGALEVILTAEEKSIIEEKTTGNIEAYNHYLVGNYLFHHQDEKSFLKAIDQYLKAIELDPTFAEAYCQLAFTYFYLDMWFVPCPCFEHVEEAYSNVAKAIAYDPKLGEAYYLLGDINYMYEWDWKTAEENFVKGLEINPDFTFGRIEYTNFLTSMKHFDEAIRIGRRTIKIDPRNHLAYNELVFTLLLNGDNGDDEEALELLNISNELLPDFHQTLYLQTLYYTKLGQYDKALSYWEKMKELDSINLIAAVYIGTSGQLLGFAGREEEALNLLNELNRRVIEEGFEHRQPQAWIYIGLGEKEKALGLLEEGYVKRDLWMIFLNIIPYIDSLRSHERFQAIMDKMNFPDTDN
ncbi:MAG: tetratricopeptide repeat protein [Bacteroidales bacterium]|nr:tetratricopeptide repeat protein [Bacteroidales bacterium]